ncbi:MAG: hypothetical protein AB7F66_17675 [Bacteriovoracia bacterium]
MSIEARLAEIERNADARAAQAGSAKPQVSQYLNQRGLTGRPRILQLEAEGAKLNDTNWVYSWLAEAGLGGGSQYSFVSPIQGGFARSQLIAKVARPLIVERGWNIWDTRDYLDALQQKYNEYGVFDGIKDFATSAPGAIVLGVATAGIAGAALGGAAAATGGSGGSGPAGINLSSATSNLSEQIPKALGSITADIVKIALPQPQKVASLVPTGGAGVTGTTGSGGAQLDPATGQPLNSGLMPGIIVGVAILAAYLIARRK